MNKELAAEIERMFFISDAGQAFRLIEDEDGDVWWGYGHWKPEDFVNEVNRWLHHICYNGASHPDDLFAANTPVEHLWAKCYTEDRFKLVEESERDDQCFPVTRLMM